MRDADADDVSAAAAAESSSEHEAEGSVGEGAAPEHEHEAGRGLRTFKLFFAFWVIFELDTRLVSFLGILGTPQLPKKLECP